MVTTLALVPAQEEAHGGGGPLTVEGGLMLWTIFIFLLLFLVLKRYAWPQVLGAVDAREKALEAQLAEAERNRAESARLLEEHKKLVADARSDVLPGGLLQIVVQRRVPLERRLAKHFARTETVAQTGRYRVWRARIGVG